MRGPLDILRETWEELTSGNESVVSYVLTMRDKLAKMSELVQENLERAQATQKKWYDRTARAREFTPGDKVLVLLPTSTNKVRAQWQGPYTVVQKNGEANYVVDMDDKRKRLRTFHVNMLREWHESKPLALFASDADGRDPNYAILWDDGGSAPPTAACEAAFKELKRRLTCLPVLI